MFALRAKEKLISIEKKDREKRGKKILDRKKELQKFHEGLLPGDPRIGAVRRPNTAAKRNAKVSIRNCHSCVVCTAKFCRLVYIPALYSCST